MFPQAECRGIKVRADPQTENPQVRKVRAIACETTDNRQLTTDKKRPTTDNMRPTTADG